MKGRWLAIVCAPLLVALLLGAVRRDLRRLQASRLTWSAEQETRAVLSRQAPPRALVASIAALRRARELDPLSIEAVAAQGDLFLAINRLQGAQDAYRAALHLEPRAEVYANLALTFWSLGRHQAARALVHKVWVLDPGLIHRLPPALRRVAPQRRRAARRVKRRGS